MQGESAFYEGKIAKNLVRELKGAVSEEDLRSYEVVEREAIEANVQNFRVSVKLSTDEFYSDSIRTKLIKFCDCSGE